MPAGPRIQHGDEDSWFFSSGHLSPLQRGAAAEYRCHHVSSEAAAMKKSDKLYIVVVELLKKKYRVFCVKAAFRNLMREADIR